MTHPYVWHVTLDTGHSRRSSRREVDDAVVTIARQQIDEALADMMPTIRDRYVLIASTAGGALMATILGPKSDPICTIAVARNSRQSAMLWPMLGADGSAPQAPWCAVRLYPALARHADAALWLGDFERNVAWAWLDARQAS